MVISPLWRTCVIALVVALVGNVLLYRLTADDDAFANVVAIGSGLAALLLLLSWVFPKVIEIALGLSFIVWTANLIEFAFQDDVYWESQVRQGCLYAGFAIVSLGCWLTVRDKRYGI